MQLTIEIPDAHLPRAQRVACASLGGHDPDTCPDKADHLVAYAQKMAADHILFTERRWAEQEAAGAVQPIGL
ncbi:hypothetical protein E3_1010 [Rhodococcus phage E3]|uniref:hypothetical protein n=1 Tax=Rhodococcus phage E3 TaxID=1007869 RepID=UPI0002C6AEA8|nr:hypothetical protein M176_gp106 [Rhodococcus phage E3]AEQ21015.1 hypothetical protein E3_1010 [Rhodococcus phage E3]